jgi:hypothetical protein
MKSKSSLDFTATLPVRSDGIFLSKKTMAYVRSKADVPIFLSGKERAIEISGWNYNSFKNISSATLSPSL